MAAAARAAVVQINDRYRRLSVCWPQPPRAANQTFPHELTRASLMEIFALAPFAVFAPVLLVLLSRYIRRDECAAA